jgi:hypothetical protein
MIYSQLGFYPLYLCACARLGSKPWRSSRKTGYVYDTNKLRQLCERYDLPLPSKPSPSSHPSLPSLKSFLIETRHEKTVDLEDTTDPLQENASSEAVKPLGG